MSAHEKSQLQEESKKYITIFIILLAMSLVSVAISYLPLALPARVALALIIACGQVFVAAGYFMHLLTEKHIYIYIVLVLTAVFAIAELSLPTIESHDPIKGTVHHNVN